MVWSMERFRHYLYGQKFVVVSDCSAVAALKAKNGSPQINRWLNRISEFEFEVRHRPGVSMAHVDALSREPHEEGVEEVDDNLPTDIRAVKVRSVRADDGFMRTVQVGDEEIQKRIRILLKDEQERSGTENGLIGGFHLIQGLLFKKEGHRMLFVIPNSQRKYILIMNHDRAGHFGMEKTMELIRRRYWFPGMKKYIKFHLKACFDCIYNKEKGGKSEGLTNIIRAERKPFSRIFIDHLGPLIKSNRKEHIIAAVDGLTKFVVLEAVTSTKTAEVIKFLERIFAGYGKPDRIVSDQGTAFTSGAFRKFLEQHAVTHIRISTQHANSNGQVERMNKEIARLLRSLCQKEDCSDWSRWLPDVQLWLNRTMSRSLGKSPFEVLHGYLPRINAHEQFIEGVQERLWTPAAEIQAEIRGNLEESQDRYKRYSDMRKRIHIRYAVGDIVFVKRLPVPNGQPTKLQRKYRGPMTISRVLANDSYKLVEIGSDREYVCTAHSSQLKWYHGHDDDDDDEGDGQLDEDGQQIIVEAGNASGNSNENETNESVPIAISDENYSESGAEAMDWRETSMQEQPVKFEGSYREGANTSTISSEGNSTSTEASSTSSEEPRKTSQREQTPLKIDLNAAILESPEIIRENRVERRRQQPHRQGKYRPGFRYPR